MVITATYFLPLMFRLYVLYRASGMPKKTDGNIFTVREIYGKRIGKKGNIEYLVSWLGYPKKCDSWVPANGILDSNLIRAYEEKEKILIRQDENEFSRKMKKR